MFIVRFFEKNTDFILKEYIDWFEIDCLLRKYNLIIEIDWPHHEEWKRKWSDKIRDEYFLQNDFKLLDWKTKKI